MEKITAYTDGSAVGNGREDAGCGWACKLMWKDKVYRKSGNDIGRTNNQMEMKAVLEAMRAIKDKSITVEVFSDSSYVVETLNGRYKIKKNASLWKELFEEKAKFADISFIWVKGHDKDQHNIEVDKMAAEESWKAKARLAGMEE